MNFSREVDVLMPTLGLNGDTAEQSLKHLPFKYRLYKSDNPGGWPVAMNEMLRERKRVNGDQIRDVLVMDDDITLLKNTFNGFDKVIPKADVFGFKLMFQPGFAIQHDGGFFDDELFIAHFCTQRLIRLHRAFSRLFNSEWKQPSQLLTNLGRLFLLDVGQSSKPAYVGFVSASLCYIKDEAVRDIAYQEWPGSYWEDVAFCVDAWRKHFKVMYYPGKALHGSRKTKTTLNFGEFSWGSPKWKINRDAFYHEYKADVKRLADYFKPFGNKIDIGQSVQPL